MGAISTEMVFKAIGKIVLRNESGQKKQSQVLGSLPTRSQKAEEELVKEPKDQLER